jgi:hypothetical protein
MVNEYYTARSAAAVNLLLHVSVLPMETIEDGRKTYFY